MIFLSAEINIINDDLSLHFMTYSDIFFLFFIDLFDSLVVSVSLTSEFTDVTKNIN